MKMKGSFDDYMRELADIMYGARSMFKPIPFTADDFRQYIPGNTAIEEGVRRKYAELQLHRVYDKPTEKPLAQFSSPHGPLEIQMSVGHTVNGKYYLKSSVTGVSDSRTGEPLDGAVEAYLPLSGPNPPERELFVAARKLFLDAYMHEAEENFRWNGKMVLDPHDKDAVKDVP